MKTTTKILLILVLSLLTFVGCGCQAESEVEKKVTIYNDTTVCGRAENESEMKVRVAMRGSLGREYASELQYEPVYPDAKSVINARAGNYPGPEYPYLPSEGLKVDTWSHDGYIENLNITETSRNEGYIETAGYAGRTCDGYIECMR